MERVATSNVSVSMDMPSLASEEPMLSVVSSQAVMASATRANPAKYFNFMCRLSWVREVIRAWNGVAWGVQAAGYSPKIFS